MAKKIAVPRGTTDLLPEQIPIWHNIEQKARQILHNYNYQEIRTPIFEEIGLFQRSLGQTSDVVNKQLLQLASDKKEGFALRPEGTASIVRSYIENNIDKKENLSKYYYIGPMFRGERPQKGRLRQFHQIGVEVIGPAALHPFIDAEVIALNVYLLKAFGLIDFTLKVNTLGSLKDKEIFSKHLRTLLKPKVKDLCEECQKRIDRNVFRVLDCKNKTCEELVKALKIDYSHLSEESQTYFEKMTQALDGLKIKYEIAYDLVRGLDYYTHTVFEIVGTSLGSQDVLSAGGRYNHLVSELGGRKIPAIGFALGIERVILSTAQGDAPKSKPLKAFVLAMEEQFLGKAFKIVELLRAGGFSSDMSYSAGSMKSQMRLANKLQAQTTIIIGEAEDKNNLMTLKCMDTGKQSQVSINDLIPEIEKLTSA